MGTTSKGLLDAIYSDPEPALALLISSEFHGSLTRGDGSGTWSVLARFVRLDPEDGKPRNLTGHPIDDFAIRAQRGIGDSLDERIFAFRVVRDGFHIDDPEDLEKALKAMRLIARRVRRIDDEASADFARYFKAVAQAIGTERCLFTTSRSGSGMYSDNAYEETTVDEAVARIIAASAEGTTL